MFPGVTRSQSADGMGFRLSEPSPLTVDSSSGMGNTSSAAPLGAAAAPGGEKHIRLELDIQKEKMGKLIGTQGKTIQAVQLRAQNITLRTPSKEEALADDGTKFVSVVLSGRAADVFKTAEMINGIVNVCLAVLTVSVLPKDVAPLLHPSIRNLQKELEVDTLKLPRKNDKPPRVVVEGYIELVQAAYQRILIEVERIAREQTDARESKKLKEISASRMDGGKEDGDGDVDGEGEDKAPGGKVSKADVKDGGAGGKKDKAGKQQGAKDPGPTVTERLSLPDAGVSILKKGRMHSIEKETRAKLCLEGSVVVIEGGGSCVNKAKRDVERMLRKLDAKGIAGKEGQEGGNEKSTGGDGSTAVLSEAAVACIGGKGGDPKGGSEGAVSACDA